TDHPPPHFHAAYAGQQVQIEIDSLRVLAGSLPPRALGLVMEWAVLHRPDLHRAWVQASKPGPVDPIAPLP
ncbi:MAG: DUF4160 domain-containing protein, partial [Phycisphaerales bacterium]|nr:DUF4160 domain-containing protein [Phycisphaerales bacterium]